MFVMRVTKYKQSSIVNKMRKIFILSVQPATKLSTARLLRTAELLDKLIILYPYGYLQSSVLLALDQNIEHRMKIKLTTIVLVNKVPLLASDFVDICLVSFLNVCIY